MRRFPIVIATLGLAAALAPGSASAQADGARTSVFDLRPGVTQHEFDEFIAELGPVLRFRQVSDAAPLGRGKIELGVQLGNTPFDDSKLAWSAADRKVDRSISFPQLVARFGVSERIDVGAWGGLDPRAKYALAGADAKIAVLRQGPGRPVSVSVRPSIGSLVYPSEVWAGTAGLDLSVSRTFGRLTPYAGVSATTSLGIERSEEIDLDPATADRSFAYAGLSYRWRTLVLSAEVEKGAKVGYAFRVGKRF